MLNLNEARGEVLELPRKEARRSERKTPPRRQTRPVKASSTAWQSTALFALCVLFVLSIGLAIHSYQRSE